MIKNYVLFLSFGVVALGCGDVKDADRKTEVFKVNNEEASAYYSSFVTKKKRAANEQVRLYTSSTTVPNNSSPVKVDLQVVLYDDGTYEGIYQENNWYPAQNLKGQWLVKQTSLVIGDLGLAAGAEVNGRKGFLLLMNRDIQSPGLKGKTFTFSN